MAEDRSRPRSRRWVTSMVDVGDARLETVEQGSGEPVLFLQTGLTVDELMPVADRLPDGYRAIHYRRRGYGRSTAAPAAGSIPRDAADAGALVRALDIERAHVVGLSYSGAVGMQWASVAPRSVHSLTLIEPPPLHVPRAPEFRAANERLMEARRVRGADLALDGFLTVLVGPHWRTDMERDLPGSVEQARRDAGTFFDADLTALLDWRFSAAEARRISCPILYVGGTVSGPWFAEVRTLMLDWFPQAEDVVVDGADHSLAITHTEQVADAVIAFLNRHPMR